MFNVEEELKKLPRKPGVYIMRDDKDVILYVGKAINLHNRVRSYFRENIGRGPAIDQMVSLIARFEYIVTDSELEALVLENNLIKENSPKYNTLLKDDKTYPYIKVTVGEDYPRILFSRTMKKDKSRYFGPYTSAAACSANWIVISPDPSAVVELCAVSAPPVVPSAFPHPAIVNSIAAAQVSAIIFLQYFFIIIVPSLFLYMNII